MAYEVAIARGEGGGVARGMTAAARRSWCYLREIEWIAKGGLGEFPERSAIVARRRWLWGLVLFPPQHSPAIVLPEAEESLLFSVMQQHEATVRARHGPEWDRHPRLGPDSDLRDLEGTSSRGKRAQANETGLDGRRAAVPSCTGVLADLREDEERAKVGVKSEGAAKTSGQLVPLQ
nr:hypothetical protein CFP56_01032 [Quercus suber]